MTRYTQKQLREMIKDKIAIDLTHATCDTRKELEIKEGWLTQIGYAAGVYGCNGMLLQGHASGQLYAIPTRSQAIFIF